MAAAADPLDDMLSSDLDEKALSDMVGSLESQLAGPRNTAAGVKAPATTSSRPGESHSQPGIEAQSGAAGSASQLHSAPGLLGKGSAAGPTPVITRGASIVTPLEVPQQQTPAPNHLQHHHLHLQQNHKQQHDGDVPRQGSRAVNGSPLLFAPQVLPGSTNGLPSRPAVAKVSVVGPTCTTRGTSVASTIPRLQLAPSVPSPALSGSSKFRSASRLVLNGNSSQRAGCMIAVRAGVPKTFSEHVGPAFDSATIALSAGSVPLATSTPCAPVQNPGMASGFIRARQTFPVAVTAQSLVPNPVPLSSVSVSVLSSPIPEPVKSSTAVPVPVKSPSVSIPVKSLASVSVPVTFPASIKVPVTSPALLVVPVSSPASVELPVTSPTLVAVSVTSPASGAVLVTSTAPVAAPVTPPAPVPVPVTPLAPVPVPVTSLPPVPVPVTSLAPVPVPVTPLAPVPVPVTSLAPVPVPVTPLAPVPVPVTSLPPVPVPVTSLAPVRVPVTSLAPVPIPVTSSTSVTVPVTSQTSVPVPVTSQTSVPVPVTPLASVSVPVTTTAPVPVAITSPSPASVSVTSQSLVSVPVTSPSSVSVPVTSLSLHRAPIVSASSVAVPVTALSSSVSTRVSTPITSMPSSVSTPVVSLSSSVPHLVTTSSSFTPSITTSSLVRNQVTALTSSYSIQATSSPTMSLPIPSSVPAATLSVLPVTSTVSVIARSSIPTSSAVPVQVPIPASSIASSVATVSSTTAVPSPARAPVPATLPGTTRLPMQNPVSTITLAPVPGRPATTVLAPVTPRLVSPALTITRPVTPQQTFAVRPTQTTVQLPPGFTIPQGMVLVQKDGQLILLPHAALSQLRAAIPNASQTPRLPSTVQTTVSQAIARKQQTTIMKPASAGRGGTSQPIAIQVNRTSPALSPAIKVTVASTIPSLSACKATANTISAAPSRPISPASVGVPGPKSTVVLHPAPVVAATGQSGSKALVMTPELLENVRKCKNFLMTLIKLSSSDSQSLETARNVRELVQSLLDSKLEAEEFTERLQTELKSSPQPYLVPFLKRSLPALRQMNKNPQYAASILSGSPSPLATSGATAAQQAVAAIALKQRVVTPHPTLQLVQSPSMATVSVAQPKAPFVQRVAGTPSQMAVQVRQLNTGIVQKQSTPLLGHIPGQQTSPALGACAKYKAKEAGGSGFRTFSQKDFGLLRCVFANSSQAISAVESSWVSYHRTPFH
uniref:uncharacterized protein isoform X2 n=1 Tax=Myxine glutinosa TaxID=7769 RepID=UPI00358F29AE